MRRRLHRARLLLLAGFLPALLLLNDAWLVDLHRRSSDLSRNRNAEVVMRRIARHRTRRRPCRGLRGIGYLLRRITSRPTIVLRRPVALRLTVMVVTRLLLHDGGFLRRRRKAARLRVARAITLGVR